MRNFKILITLFSLVSIASCQKHTDIAYGITNQGITEVKAKKIKPKSQAEYISILFTGLHQKPISPSQLAQSENVLYSIGDQNVGKEMLLSNYFNSGSVIIPTNQEMRADVPLFVTNTFKKFYLRFPGESEKQWFVQYINNRPNLTVEMIYTAFAASDEYGFY